MRQDELQVLPELMNARGPVFRRHQTRVYVGDPVSAKEVLANKPPRYREHSDFFYTKQGVLGPRPVQIAIGRGIRTLLQQDLDCRQANLTALVERHLVPVSYWPDAANWLLYARFGHVLLGPGSPEPLRGLIEQVVRRAVLAGAAKRRLSPDRIAFRRKVMRELTAEITARRRSGTSLPDALGVVIQSAPLTADASQLAEVFLSCLFAVTGAIGFVLAWSVFLVATAPPVAEFPASCIVREALRLWPVAWLFVRRPDVPHELGGIAVTPHDEVAVCNYLVHRNPAHWEAPDEFRPQRWVALHSSHAYLPFGWGPHSCPGAGLAVQFAEQVLTELTEGYHLSIAVLGSRPHISAALAPAEFTIHLKPHRQWQ